MTEAQQPGFERDPFPGMEHRSGVHRSVSLDDLGEKLDRLEAIVVRAVARTELGVRDAERAAVAAEETRDYVRGMKAIVHRQANDFSRLRHGIPASWFGRLGLVGAAAMIGAVSAVMIVACGHPVMIP